MDKYMRILVVGAIQGGTVPLGPTLAKAFAANNQEVDFLDYSDSLDELIAARQTDDKEQLRLFYIKIKIRLLERVIFFRPEVIFGISQSPLYDPEILTQFKNAGICLCYWFTEDYKVFDYWKSIVPYFDYFFTIQQHPFWQELQKMGLNNFYYLPMAFDDTVLASNSRIPDIPVSFVGAPYPNRVFYLDKIHENIRIFGEGWNKYLRPAVEIGDRRISEEEAHQIYMRTHVNINLHSSVYADGFADGDFVNPRTFEIAGLGAFQLTDLRSLLSLHFDLNEEIVASSNFTDMSKSVKYFLIHEKERLTFAQKAQKRVLEQHTYRHRAAAVIKLLR
ncbi:MAG: glycosyltransferase [Smithellaceae bacterium]